MRTAILSWPYFVTVTMSEIVQAQLAHADFLAEEAAWEDLTAFLSQPLEFPKNRPPLPGVAFETLVRRIDSRLSERDELKILFRLNLLSIRLQYPEEVAQLLDPFIAEHGIRESLIPGIALSRLNSERWVQASVLSALGDMGCLRYFIVGRILSAASGCSLPSWAEALLDTSAKDALADAAVAAVRLFGSGNGGSFFCFPLCKPNQNVQIQGRSLGLPLGLAFSTLLSGEASTHLLAATGDLNAEGGVGRVGLLAQKMACLYWSRRRFKGLLVPAESAPLPVCPGVEFIPVANLEEAVMFCGLYEPGKADLLVQLSAALRDPFRFVTACRSLDYRWIFWAVSAGKLKAVSEEIATSTDLFGQLTARLDEALKSWNLKVAGAISGVITGDFFEKAATASPLTAFKWCTLNLSLSNHLGDVVSAEKWMNSAESMIPGIRRIDEGTVIEHYNTCLVLRHNHYHFSDQLPAQLTELIRSREVRYRLQCTTSECRTDIPLGRLYGTLGQHFAFCGPAKLAESENYFGLARQLLGEGTVSEHRPEWQRQLNYLTYAYSDAQMYEKAERTLCEYLEVRQLNEIWPRLSSFDRWKHSLLARFLADAGSRTNRENYLGWVKEHPFNPPDHEHPWQLWAFNAGRMELKEGHTQSAVRFLNFSIDLCLATSAGPTVKIMALLPLSKLAEINKLPEPLNEIEDKLRQAAGLIAPAHFHSLMKRPFEQMLEKVQLRPQEFFPFTYR
jgi:hypothetical protein